MKGMKWIGVLTIMVAVGLAASGCGGSDGGGGDGLEGNWKATSLNGLPIPAGVVFTLTLSGNGTYTGYISNSGITVTEVGTWSTSGSTLTTVHEDETENVTYSLAGNTLVLSDPEGIFTMTRQ